MNWFGSPPVPINGSPARASRLDIVGNGPVEDPRLVCRVLFIVRVELALEHAGVDAGIAVGVARPGSDLASKKLGDHPLTGIMHLAVGVAWRERLGLKKNLKAVLHGLPAHPVERDLGQFDFRRCV